uniref:Transmembrane protein n=1 Tax=Globodera pallida TaxID=36090 RepID=A0A183BMY8_GLOPA
MLWFQSMSFCLPNLLWKFFIQKIDVDFIAIIDGAINLKGMEKAPIEERQKLIKCLQGMLSEAVLHQTWGATYVVTCLYVFIKLLYLVNVGTQFVMLNSLIGHGYRLWCILGVAFLTLFNFIYCLCVLLPLLLLPHSRDFFVRGLLTQERRRWHSSCA